MKFIHRLTTNPLATVGAITILALVLVALFAPALSPQDPDKVHGKDQFAPPLTGPYVLGADELGRDVLSRIIFGSRVSLAVAAVVVLAATAIGATAGIVAGYFGGWIDTVIMRVVDVLFAIPTMMLALVVISLLGRATGSLIFALAVGFTPSFARVCYSNVVSTREARFVEASRSLGGSPWYILRKDILPNILPFLMVQMTIYLARAMLAEASLGFLGLGVMPPTSSWGSMLSSSRQFVFLSPTLGLFPGLAVLIAVFAFNLFGDGLRDLLDPRAWQLGD